MPSIWLDFVVHLKKCFLTSFMLEGAYQSLGGRLTYLNGVLIPSGQSSVLEPTESKSQLSDKHTYSDSKVHGVSMGPPGADRSQVGPMLATWTLLSEYASVKEAAVRKNRDYIYGKESKRYLIKLKYYLRSGNRANKSWVKKHTTELSLEIRDLFASTGRLCFSSIKFLY